MFDSSYSFLRTAGSTIARIGGQMARSAAVVGRLPLVQFLLLGALIFVIARLADDRSQARVAEIHIGDGVERHLGSLYRNQFGVAPDRAALDELMESYIDDEVLYREGLRLGLDKGDEIVRQRIVQKMRFLLSGRSLIAEPGEKALRDYYAAHRRQFAKPASVTFRQVYFAASPADGTAPPQRARAALEDLRHGARSPEAPAWDRSPVAESFSALDAEGSRRVFGDTPIVAMLFAAPLKEWSGPFRSGYGWHLIYVSERTEERSPAFSELRGEIRQAWLEEARKAKDERALEELRSKYKVVRDQAGARG